jgi:hypothetical protein
MKITSLVTLTTIAMLVGCAEAPDSAGETDGAEEATAVAAQALTPPGGDQCALVSTANVDDLLRVVESAQARIAATLAAHPNDSTTYLAGYVSTDLTVVHARVADARAWLLRPTPDNDPSTTSYGEGSGLYSFLNETFQTLHMAEYYAMLASYYLYDADARLAYERIAVAIELDHDLSVRAGRCLMGPPSGG